MAAFGDYLEQAIINHWLRNTAMAAPPASVNIHLYTSATDDAGGGTEVAGNGYAPLTVSTTGSFSAPNAAGQTSNINVLEWAAASGGAWGTVTHFAIKTTGGDVLLHGALTQTKAVGDQDIFRLGAGLLVITLA